MKDMGMEKIIFSKNYTLTKPGENEFLNEKIEESYQKAIETFKYENTLIMSELTEPNTKD